MFLELSICSLLLVAAYLLGSIPTGYTAGKLLKGIDIREEGSGSTGATNVLRTLGKVPALVVLLVDAFKGVAALSAVNTFYAFKLMPLPLDWQPWLIAAAGFAVIFGHSRSIWLNFTGGKSVATSLGVLLTMCWQVGLGTGGVFGIVFALSRIVSLSSISGAIAVSILMILFKQPLPYVIFGAVAGFYVIWRHRSNIQRLLAGTEPKIGQKVPTEETEAQLAK